MVTSWPGCLSEWTLWHRCTFLDRRVVRMIRCIGNWRQTWFRIDLERRDQLNVRFGNETGTFASFGHQPTLVVGFRFDEDFLVLSHGHLIFVRTLEIVQNNSLARERRTSAARGGRYFPLKVFRVDPNTVFKNDHRLPGEMRVER